MLFDCFGVYVYWEWFLCVKRYLELEEKRRIKGGLKSNISKEENVNGKKLCYVIV